MAQLRGDQSTLPIGQLFRTISPAPGTGGTIISGRPASIQLTATLSPAPARTGHRPVNHDRRHRRRLPDPGGHAARRRPPAPAHRSPAGSKASYPLRLAQITLSYVLPAQGRDEHVTLTVSGVRLSGWTAAGRPARTRQGGMLGQFAAPVRAIWQPAADGGTFTFSLGSGDARPTPRLCRRSDRVGGRPAHARRRDLAPAAVPAIATKAFVDASNTSVGATVPATIGGITIPVRIVAQTTTFPTVTRQRPDRGPADLRRAPSPVAAARRCRVTQWWLATAGHGLPPGLAAALPARLGGSPAGPGSPRL